MTQPRAEINKAIVMLYDVFRTGDAAALGEVWRNFIVSPQTTNG